MGARGSGFQMPGPPATTMASSSARSQARTGTRARSRASTTLVPASSWAMETPTMPKDATGDALSRESIGTPAARMASAMSGHGR